jgi:serine/threonine-protein kinase
MDPTLVDDTLMDHQSPPQSDSQERTSPSSERISQFLRTVQETPIAEQRHDSHGATEESAHKINAAELLSDPKDFKELGGYELIKRVGHGGMGVVYRARHQQTKQLVALKIIASHRLTDAEHKRRFVLEAETASLLNHPNIVSVHDAGQERGFHYMVMDYVESITLSHLLEDQPLESDTSARVALSLAETLSYVHGEGILHRDLKPSNILVDKSGKPWLTDFGVAKRLFADDWVTATGMLLGTPSYMPPEQIAGKHEAMGPASDVYALGAVLYEMLTGRPPFRSSSPFDTLQMALYTNPSPPRRFDSSISKDLEAICLKCLSKAPHMRYASAADVATDLRAFLQKQPTTARRQRLTWPASTSSWRDQRLMRDPEVLAQWGLVFGWSAVLLFVLFLGASLAEWGELTPKFLQPLLSFGGLTIMGAIIWSQRFRYAKPLTALERQVGRIWALVAFGAFGTLFIGQQMVWSWSLVLPILLLLGGLGFASMALFVTRTFLLMTCLCLLSAGIVFTHLPIPPVVFGLAFAIGLYLPARTLKAA